MAARKKNKELTFRDKQRRTMIILLTDIRDSLRDLVTLQQQEVDLFRALVNDEGDDWKNK